MKVEILSLKFPKIIFASPYADWIQCLSLGQILQPGKACFHLPNLGHIYNLMEEEEHQPYQDLCADSRAGINFLFSPPSPFFILHFVLFLSVHIIFLFI